MSKLKLKIFFVLLCVIFSFSLTNSFAQTQEEQLAAQYFEDREFEKATELYEKLFKKNKAFYSPYLNCLLALEKYSDAEDVIKKLLKKDSENTLYLVDLGTVYKLQGNKDETEKQYNNAIKVLKPDQQVITDLANLFIAKQEYDFAVKTYQRGRKLMAGIYQFNFELAEVYSYQKNIPAMFNEYMDALVLNAAYQEKVENAIQTALSDDVNGKKKEYLETVLIEKVQENPNNMLFAQLLIWHYIQQNNFESAFIHARALDKKLKEDGSRLIELSNICTANKEYETAIKCLQYVMKKGQENYYYSTAKSDLVQVMNKKITEKGDYTQADLDELETLYRSTLDELGNSAQTVVLMRGLAHHLAFYQHKTDEAITMLQQCIDLPRITQKELALSKLEMGDVLLFINEVWEATLLYSQVEKMYKNDELGKEAKLKNAKLSFYIGQFDWAQAQLNVLKAATSQLIANDALYLALLISDNTIMDSNSVALQMFATADLLYYQNKTEEALLKLDSIETMYPNHSLTDDIYYKKAQIFLKKQRVEEAVANLHKIVDDYFYDILADDALYMLAGIYENRLNNKEKAMELYQDLLLKFPGSLYTVDARVRYRALRGDKIN